MEVHRIMHFFVKKETAQELFSEAKKEDVFRDLASKSSSCRNACSSVSFFFSCILATGPAWAIFVSASRSTFAA